MARRRDLPDEEYEDDDPYDEDEDWDENEPPAHGRDASFRGASPIIMMLLIWGLGFWVAWSMGIGYGWTHSTHLRGRWPRRSSRPSALGLA